MQPLRGYSEVPSVANTTLTDIKMSTTKPGTGEIMQNDPLVSYGAPLRAIVDHSVCQARVLGQDVHRAFEDRSSEIVADLHNPANFAD